MDVLCTRHMVVSPLCPLCSSQREAMSISSSDLVHVPLPVYWSPPPPGHYKLNVDASVKEGANGVGAVVRDSAGLVLWLVHRGLVMDNDNGLIDDLRFRFGQCLKAPVVDRFRGRSGKSSNTDSAVSNSKRDDVPFEEVSNEELLVSQEIAKVLEFFIGSETKALSVSVFDVHSEIPSSKVDSSRTFNSDEFSSIQQPLQSDEKEEKNEIVIRELKALRKEMSAFYSVKGSMLDHKKIRELEDKIDKILEENEIYLQQHSWALWLKAGDKNTVFFFFILKLRKRGQ
ncbi:hypothetical protein ACOSQ2_021057 [Xanthoceras sorbifolium]